MSDTPGFYATQAKMAEERILGTKFCFACGSQRPLEGGRNFLRGKNRIWKCMACANKTTQGFIKRAAK